MLNSSIIQRRLRVAQNLADDPHAHSHQLAGIWRWRNANDGLKTGSAHATLRERTVCGIHCQPSRLVGRESSYAQHRALTLGDRSSAQPRQAVAIDRGR